MRACKEKLDDVRVDRSQRMRIMVVGSELVSERKPSVESLIVLDIVDDVLGRRRREARDVGGWRDVRQTGEKAAYSQYRQ